MTDKNIYLINKHTGHKKIFNTKYRIIQNSGIHDQEFTKAGKTIGAGIDILLKNEIKSGVIHHLLPDYYIHGFEYFLLINPEGKNARTETFITFINECMQRLNLDKNLAVHDASIYPMPDIKTTTTTSSVNHATFQCSVAKESIT